jgi:2-(1,2-epoxy-1,2-dihydrophenyl)acetyl-CoA isomerase
MTGSTNDRVAGESTGDELLVSLDEGTGVARLTLNRPEKRNALSVGLRDRLVAEIRRCRRDDRVRAVVLAGAGGGFCAGMDLAQSSIGQIVGGSGEPRAMGQALREGLHALIVELWELDKPTVAAVDGAAVGPGAHAALACDFVLVTPRTRMIWSFSRYGLVVDAGGGYLLPRLVGLAMAKRLVLLGEELTGPEAAALGLAYRCVEPAELADAAGALAATLAAGPTWAMGMSKRLLNRSSETGLPDSLELEAAYQSLATTSAELRERLGYARRQDPDGRRDGGEAPP